MASSSSAVRFALFFLFILMGSTSAGKSEWPGLVGMKGSEAKKIIQRENPNVEHVIYIWCTWKWVMDFCCNHLWLFVGGESEGNHGKGQVCTTPRGG